MIEAILSVLALFVAQTLLPASLRYIFAGPGVMERLRIATGPRDEQPPVSVRAGRAERALANMQEALPVFLTLALLLVYREAYDGIGVLGAWVFVVTRVLYVPAYMLGVSGLRSGLWVVSWTGLAMMVAAMFES